MELHEISGVISSKFLNRSNFQRRFLGFHDSTRVFGSPRFAWNYCSTTEIAPIFSVFLAPQPAEHFDNIRLSKKKTTNSFKMADANAVQQIQWYSDENCTTESTLPANDPYFHMKYDETYYMKNGEEKCDPVRKTKTYMSAPVWPKTSVCITSNGKETCLDYVSNSGQVNGCAFSNASKMQSGVTTIDCRKEGDAPCVIS